jgi:hypothetical protein
MRHVSKVLVDLAMPPILEIPWNLRTAADVLEAVDIILEPLKEAYDSVHSSWD